MPPSAATHVNSLTSIVDQLHALKGRLDDATIESILKHSALGLEDVYSYIASTPMRYGRRRVTRTSEFEVLVMTWLPGQRTGAHDHAGALSVFKILQGAARETLFTQRADSLVEIKSSRNILAGEVGVDPGDIIHEISNESPDQALITLHVYAPPLPELRRFAARSPQCRPATAFHCRRDRATPVVAIIGGGFSGVMVAAQLARKAADGRRPLHAIIIDRQTTLAEGAAYRTTDASHLLNVPAYRMSAWAERPNDFIDWAKKRDPAVAADSYLQRRAYGEYLRATFFEAVAESEPYLSIELHRREAERISRRAGGGWRIHCDRDEELDADAVVLATGHRPPDDPLARCWVGSKARYVEDPWASLALGSIEPDESICLLGSGLTAIDVLQSVSQCSRTGHVLLLSRRGLLPAAHAAVPLGAIDPSAWLEPVLNANGITTSSLTRLIRRQIENAPSGDLDWRQVVDGLRPFIARIWQALPTAERKRFMRHVKAHWEAMRHRMAPEAAEAVHAQALSGVLHQAAGRVMGALGADDGVTLTIRRRGAPKSEKLQFDWVVNCTGPGISEGAALPPVLSALFEEGYLERDPCGLGVLSAPDGCARANGRVIGDLIVIGTLRKADLWESTAVPELRQQAADAADAVLRSDNCHRLDTDAALR